ncbi:MAG: hypothetical protein FGM37_00740 [Phycisphaerales bacterium]|nr:hypothetical protein [Phycisphaerales bacterium]
MQHAECNSEAPRLHWTVAAAAWLLGAALLVYYVGSFGVNVPIADDWDHIKTSIDWNDNGITAVSLLALHNEHRLAVPRLVTHATLVLSAGDYRAILLLNAGIALVSLAIILKAIARLPLSRWELAAASIAVSVLFTSWCQWQNWLWAFQTPWFLLPLLVVAAAAAVAWSRSAWTAAAIMAAAAILAPMIMVNGIFVGWALLPALALRVRHEPATRAWPALAAGAFCATATTAWTLLAGSGLAGARADVSAGWLDNSMDALRLLITVLGAPLDPAGSFHGKSMLAAIAGALSLAAGSVAAIASWRGLPRDRTSLLGVAYALMIFGVGSVGAVVMGRTQLLSSDPIQSRYQTLAIAWHVGVLLCYAWLASNRRSHAWRVLLMAISAVFIAVTVSALPLFRIHGTNMRTALEGHQLIYREARDPGRIDALRSISRHYGPDEILRRLDGMRRAGFLHPDYAPDGQADGPLPKAP